MSDEKLIGRREGAVGHIIFNNPEKRNAVSLEMWQRVNELLTEYAADPSLRVLVVSGAGGKAFVSGADISKFESERATKEGVERYNQISTAAYNALFNFPKPTIAKINGYCIGGGMNVAACCDLRFCEEGSRFAIPAGRLGLGYGYIGVNRLSRIIGISRAMEMFYTARQFTALEAYEMGLVNSVLPVEELDSHVDTLAAGITENAPLTIATIKAVAIEMGKAPNQPDHAKLDRMVLDCFESEDYVEGRRAFMEKRKPVFKGR
ncbi:MAG: enoyl-CoA hydratase/isomerase family protein [Hyphomicrobiaceae bacterium]|nr:enoyl-CoA hydratase/isomerase family protein [Hyphomicrobiaceae bacterium]